MGLHAPAILSGTVPPLFASLRASETTLGLGLALLVGVGAGLGAVLFRWMIGSFESLFFNRGAEGFSFLGHYYVIIIPALGGLIVGPLVYFFAREAKGHGVPEVMAAVATKGGRIRPRVVVIKSLASSICIGSGGSVGREGPIVQIGSAIGSTLGQWLRLPEDWIRTLVASGAAAGIAATFNAPIAGIFFGMEIILRRYEARAFGVIVFSSVVATAISHLFFGTQPSFMVPTYELVSAWEFPLYLVLGVLAALTAHVFVWVLYKLEDLFDGLSFPEYGKPVLGGVLLGVIGLFYPQLFGVGYSTIPRFAAGHPAIDGALLGQMTIGVLLTLVALKIVATSLTLGSGGSGGVFAPSLFMGAMLGGAFGTLVHHWFPASTAPSGAYALVAMGAVFAGAARAPATAIVILFEMTRDYQIILPLMAAVIVAMVVARALRRDSVYTLKIRRAGVNIVEDERSAAVLRDVPVTAAMTADFPTVHPETTVTELTELFAETGHHGFPVVDEHNTLVGVVTMTDLAKVTANGNTRVDEIATHNVRVAYPDQSLHEALAQFGGQDIGRIPVVTRGRTPRLVGVLRRHGIIKAYAGKIAGQSRSGDVRDVRTVGTP